MGIRIVHIMACLIAFQSFGQGAEEQRKYRLSLEESTDFYSSTVDGLNGLFLQSHSSHVYYDLYFDTPDLKLYEEGYSLRFRKRIIDDSTITYGLQLKSEMTVLGEIRMEVEEKELDFYRMKENGEWVSITALLDGAFDNFETVEFLPLDPEFMRCMNLLTEWIFLKADAPIAPFQKLKAIDPELFTKKTIQSLVPYVVGVSERSRGHVFIIPTEETTDDLKSIPLNRIKHNERPLLFSEHPDWNWILETSLDRSRFRMVNEFNYPEIVLVEFEVENKYMDEAVGRSLMDRFEIDLLNTLGLEIELASKYKQVIRKYLNH
jgi:hypothetical protein